MSELPDGWTPAFIGELATKIGSGATPKGGAKAYKLEGIPLLRSLNVHFDGVRDKGTAFIDDEQAAKLDNAQVETGDVLLNITGASIGRVAVAPERYSGARVNQHVAIIRTVDGVVPAFLSRYLASPEAQSRILEENYGVTRQALTKGMIEEFPVGLPPLPEQRRIVAKLDRLSARSAAARDHLAHTTKLATRAKQSILDDIFGQDWPTEELQEFVDPERGIPYGIVQTGKDTPGGVPTVRCGDIKRFSVSADNLKCVEPTISGNYERTILRGGEVLIAIRGSIGETCVVPSDMAGCNISREVALIPVLDDVDANFIMYFLQSRRATRFINANTKGVAQTGINLRDLRTLPTPRLPLDEQLVIVRRIEAAFARIDRLTEEASRAAHLLDRLEERLLAKAFRGELVPQNPEDEPAEALLSRIRQARAAAPKPKRGRRKKVTAV